MEEACSLELVETVVMQPSSLEEPVELKATFGPSCKVPTEFPATLVDAAVEAYYVRSGQLSPWDHTSEESTAKADVAQEVQVDFAQAHRRARAIRVSHDGLCALQMGTKDRLS